MSLPDINLKVDKYEKESFYSDVVKKSQNYTNKDFEPFDQFSRRSKASITPEKTVISHKLSTAIRKHEGSMMQTQIMQTSPSLGALFNQTEFMKSQNGF